MADKALLDRLQALRGSSPNAAQSLASSSIVKHDFIERRKTPTKEDALAARLKQLRNQDIQPVSSSPSAANKTTAAEPDISKTNNEETVGDGDDIFQTDDNTLEELLEDVDGGTEVPGIQPTDDEVKALLEQLAQEVPKDESDVDRSRSSHRGRQEADEGDENDSDSDNSDGERMNRRVNDVIDRYRDEIEVETSLKESTTDGDESDEVGEETFTEDDSALPSLPSNLEEIPTTDTKKPLNETNQGADLSDLTSRMAALRTQGIQQQDDGDDSLSLPSVPTSRPSGQPVKRLTTKTGYTDDDVDGWCTVCLEDATLRCQGCDGDPYCTRCWREMHIGPAAAFDDRSHKAVQFTRDRKKKEKKVALGAS